MRTGKKKLIFAALLYAIGAVAQGGCPTLTQQQISYSNGTTAPATGLAQGAALTVNVVGSDLGSQSSDINEAATNNTSFFGSNQSVTTNKVDTDPGTVGTASNPVLTVLEVSQTTLNSLSPGCSSPQTAACTFITSADSAGHTLNAVTYVSEDHVYDAAFEQLMAHEDGHGLLGLQDCVGCSGTEMNNSATTNSPDGPTDCDDAQVYNDSGGSYGCADPCNGICAYVRTKPLSSVKIQPIK